jgi:glycosyltransferase involved in cell wall biosynthesis
MSTPADPAGKPLLHVFLLTYNRAGTFRRTLEAIAASPLREHPLTVLDNCSPDGTPRVCEEFRTILPLMKVVRHPRNIGFGGNFLRAIELSRGEYTWILGDDDTLFPDRMPSLIELLQRDRPQACFIGGPRQEQWPAGLAVRPSEIMRRFGTFLTAQSFVAAVVFKDSVIASRELIDGYFGIRTNFPQLTIGRKLLVEDIPCAVLQPPVLRREDPEEKGKGYLGVMAGWSAFCRTLPPEWQRIAFYSIYVRTHPLGMIRELSRMIIWEKIEVGGDASYLVSQIGLNGGFAVRIWLIPCRLLCLLPAGVFNLARETYRKVKYGLLRRPLPPNYHAPLSSDENRR